MLNFFAGGSGGMHTLAYPLMKNHLTAWIDKDELKLREDYFKKDCNVLIDSGAFTTFTKGKKIDIYEYSDFIKSYTLKWKKKLKSVNFINLDVIGDAEKSWKNPKFRENITKNWGW